LLRTSIFSRRIRHLFSDTLNVSTLVSMFQVD